MTEAVSDATVKADCVDNLDTLEVLSFLTLVRFAAGLCL